MARSTERLSAARVARGCREPGRRYADGKGLYLHVRHGGARQWMVRYMRGGVSHDMGLGSVDDVTLAEARELARQARRDRLAGLDPLKEREKRRLAALVAEAKTVTFRAMMEECLEAKRPEWRNPKHAQQWRNTLTTHAATLLELPVSEIDEALVLATLRPIWTEKPETASRVRGRIETVLDYASALRRRAGPNPARWKGNLDAVLAKRSKVRRVRHHPALPYSQAPAFSARLRMMAGTAPRALEFTILTASRSGEARGARWPEIDLVAAVWIVPPERVKSGREHRVALSPRAVEILRGMLPLRDQRHGDYVFPGARPGKPLSDAALSAVLDRMEMHGVVPHGFRSTFRDWAAEQTSFAWEVAEACLAHVIGDKTQQAYQRADLLEKRRRLMNAWAAYCSSPARSDTAKVIAIQGDQAPVSA